MRKMRYTTLMRKIKDGQAEVQAWEVAGTCASVIFYTALGAGKREMIEVTGAPAEVEPALVLTRFEVDFIKPFSLIVQAPPNFARTDAYNVLSVLYGASARITKAGVQLEALPADAEVAKHCDWAWFVYPTGGKS